MAIYRDNNVQNERSTSKSANKSLEKYHPRHEGNPARDKNGSKNSGSCSVSRRNGLQCVGTIVVILTRVRVALAIASRRLSQGPSRDVVAESDEVRSETIA